VSNTFGSRWLIGRLRSGVNCTRLLSFPIGAGRLNQTGLAQTGQTDQQAMPAHSSAVSVNSTHGPVRIARAGDGLRACAAFHPGFDLFAMSSVACVPLGS